MKRKITLKNIAIAMVTGVVGMSGALLNPFSAEGRVTSANANYCQHNIDGNSGIGTFCSDNVCKTLTGQGSNIGLCGSGC